MEKKIVYRNSGIGLGTVLAIIMSWTTHQSILWVIIHGFLGWFYVIYFLLFQY